KTLTPNGAAVRPRTARISASTASGFLYPAASRPSPPASPTAATSAGVEGPPAIGAARTGYRSSSIRPMTPSLPALRSSALEHLGCAVMRSRILGGTGIEVSVYCLGTMMLGAAGNPDHDECVRMVHAALDRGVNFLDTADMYS